MRKKKTRHRMFHLLDCLLILSLSVFVLLDNFVIVREYQEISQTSQAAEESGNALSSYVYAAEEITDDDSSEEVASVQEEASQDPVITDTSYEDENISVSIEEYRYADTTVYVADVQLSSAEYLKSALANGSYGKNVTAKTSEIAESVGAILAINGDFYGARNSGYVLRNGELLRDTSASSSKEDLAIMSDGSFRIFTEGSVSASELLGEGALQVYSFGPALIEDGEITVGVNEEVGQAMASNPRTAICEISPLHYLLVVSDGRSNESEGLSLYELAEFLQNLGVETAYNLDGGGSSTMVFNGNLINNPTTSGRSVKERSVSDIVYIGY